ncbi:hypothetical protein GALMADRAFT_214104 [Galerina marginata CBS 339.88]|uniref:Uncharacterized protein n=1 Tax=Galerina marginata (strain CBS 339.88) TaxID=685588 RepID=A0A067SJL9_GALM3|nr:hypothetical protein GALMADRAFT_214104 [Galerina marginata CBS 339.88]
MGADDVLRTKLFFLTTDPDLRFPEGTRGFLYYKGHRRYPLIAGSLRFRVLPEGSDDFEMGHDLTMPDGTPWQRVLSKVGDTLPVFIDKLVEEKLLLRNFWDLRKTVHLSQPPPNEPKRERKPRAKRPPPPPKPKVIRHTNLMYTKDDTFTLDLSTAHGTFSIYDPTVDSTFRTLQLWYIFRDRRKVYQSRMGHGLVPYRGSISGRFELSTLAEHQAEGGHIVMRILDILKPVELLVPDYDGFIHPPVPGELLLRGLPSRRRPWSVLLDESERGLVLRKLFFEGKKD